MNRLSLFHGSVCVTLVFGLVAGCTASVGGPAGTSGTGARTGTGNSSGSGSSVGTAGTIGGGGTTGTGASVGTLPPGDPLAAGVKPLRLLTAREYLNTVRDLLGDMTLKEPALPSGDEDANATPSFAFHVPHLVAPQDGTLFQSVAETLARNAVAKLPMLLPCAAPPAAGTAETTCLNTFMTTFMPKMYRRPLVKAEVDRLTALYSLGRGTLALGFNDAIGLVIEAALQSPEFLYHWERDQVAATVEGSVWKLGGYELANRLSYFLWGTMPDTKLFAAAAMNQLNTPALVEAQARIMLKDPKAADAMTDFFSDWLDVDKLPDMPKDTGMYPMFNDALIAAMTTEIDSFVTGIMMTGTGRFADLLTGTNSFANQPLSTFYGITPVAGTAFKAVMLNATQRAGLLTSAAFLATTGDAAESNPPRRGKAIFTKVLCGVMPPPPADVPPPQPASAGGTIRQRMVEHDRINACASTCHPIIEPLGFAFEEFGGIGEFRTTDNNAPVDSTGNIMLDGQMHPYSNAVDLVKVIAASPTAQSCFTTQWLRYAVGRGETPADQASLNSAMTAFTGSTGDVRELIVGLAKSRTFLYRTPAPGEVLQ